VKEEKECCRRRRVQDRIKSTLVRRRFPKDGTGREGARKRKGEMTRGEGEHTRKQRKGGGETPIAAGRHKEVWME